MNGRIAAAVCGLVLAAVSPGWALPKYADWARTPATGAAVANATIQVDAAGTTTVAALVDATGAALANPFHPDGTGYHEVIANTRAYDVHVLDAAGTSELYVVPNALLADALGPVRICSNPATPALTTVQVAADQTAIGTGIDPWAQLSTTWLRFERRGS